MSSVDSSLQGYEAQEVLFERIPKRRKLIDLPSESIPDSKITVNVWRNHGFEPLLPIMSKYLECRKSQIDFNISPYDDTLSFSKIAPASAEIIWLDSRRILSKLSTSEYIQWLKERISYLRTKTDSPILFVSWNDCQDVKLALNSALAELAAVYIGDISTISEEHEVSLLDERTAKLAGTSLSGKAQLVIARKLICNWLSALIFPPIKAIALDLDNTLHAGVLGEDGVSGLLLTKEHSEFQTALKDLRERGIFLALVSKNEASDAERLFNERTDYPLDWDDFSAIQVSWESKSVGIQRIANELRIAPDAILFVDDNPGELLAVKSQLPTINTIFAHEDADITQRTLKYFPGLWRWDVGEDDTKRIADLRVNRRREVLSETSTDLSEYFKALGVQIVVHNNNSAQLNRLSDLSIKTNQFNLALKRSSKIDILRSLESDSQSVISVSLSDRLSDSGIIALVIAEKRDSFIYVQELCVSCRAMGRHLEDSIIVSALRQVPYLQECKSVRFSAQIGPRNQPAITWIKKFSPKSKLNLEGYFEIETTILDRFDVPPELAITFEE